MKDMVAPENVKTFKVMYEITYWCERYGIARKTLWCKRLDIRGPTPRYKRCGFAEPTLRKKYYHVRTNFTVCKCGIEGLTPRKIWYYRTNSPVLRI
jgi:hypothetical protein